MKRIGVVDLKISGMKEGNSGFPIPNDDSLFLMSLNIFKSSPTGYVYDRSIEYSESDRNYLAQHVQDIDEFYLSLPIELLDFRIVKFPFSDTQKIRKVIPFELDSLIIDGSDSVVFDPVVLGRSDDTFDILIAYITRDLLGHILEKLSSLDIDPRIITSVELGTVLKSGNGEFGARLMNRNLLDDDDRIRGAQSEIADSTINLRTGVYAYTKDRERIGRGLKITVILFMLFVLMLHADFTLRIMNAKKETSSIKREMRSIYSSLFPEEKKIRDELYQLKSHMKQIQDRGKILLGVDTLRLLSALSQEERGAVFNEINLDRELITMKGEAESIEETDTVKAGLSEFLKNVSIKDIKPSPDDKTLFTVVAQNPEREFQARK